jgi:hypothetical protein
MQSNVIPFAAVSSKSVRLAGRHGYRLDGDTAILNAELTIAAHGTAGTASAQQWALQLWACDAPHQGGAVQGLKIAEIELAIPNEREHADLEVETSARLPRTRSDYNMVLVLASGVRGHYDSVQDFSNYTQRQQFEGPCLEGNVGYRFAEDGVWLQADAVYNSRAYDNLSGSLALELWATPQPYDGGDLRGTLVASAGLGRLEGQADLRSIERLAYSERLPAGEWQLALVLTEWTDRGGHVTRDYRRFAAPYIELAAPDSQPVVTKPAEAPKVVAAIVKEPAPTKLTSAVAKAPERAEAAQPVANEAKPAAAAAKEAEPAKVEPAKVEPAKLEAPKVEPAKVEPAKVEAAKVEAAKVEAAKVEAAKVEPARADVAKPAAATTKTSEAPKATNARN